MSLDNIRPYAPDTPHCPKCGWASAKTHYVSGGAHCNCNHVGIKIGEYIERTCAICGYTWPQWCIDRKEL